MTFDLWSRFRKPVPARDARVYHHAQRPPPMTTTHIHPKRPLLAPQDRPVRRVHHQPVMPAPRPLVAARKGPAVRAPVPARKGPALRAPAPSRKGPVVRVPARPHPPQRASSKLMNYLPFHFHPKSANHQAPPFPPPRGAMKAPPRRVHWAPAQAPLPTQPYPYPSHASSRTTTTSHATSHARTQHYPSPPAIPRYQPPAQLPPASRDLVLVPHRRR